MAHIHFYISRVWFVMNTVIALVPQVHWAVGGHEQRIFDQPATLAYFLLVSVSIAASLIYAYWEESARGEFHSC